MTLVIGILIGGLIAGAIVAAAMFDRRSHVVVVDIWWLQNEDRWMSLRPVLLRERGDGGAAGADDATTTVEADLTPGARR